MAQRAFVDLDPAPTDETVGQVIASAQDQYGRLLEATNGFRRQWSHAKGKGWTLKIHGGRKALLHLIPHHGGFVVRLTVRDAEPATLCDDGELAPVRARLDAAQRFAEGHLLQFEVFDSSDDGLGLVIAALIPLRR